MEVNEIKKALYKQTPKATITFIRKNVAYYKTELVDGTKLSFEIPIEDMSDADFFPVMETKFLIRWVQKV